MSNIPTPHMEAKEGEIAKTILLPGDPLRAKYIAENFLTDVKVFNTVRNILGFTGKYEGKEVSVMGTGMGCPSIGIYSYELINFYGVKNLIRIGTAGSMQSYVHVRDLVIAQAASYTSNYPKLFGLNGTYAPVCSYELLEAAVNKSKELNLNYHVGGVLSSDMFYAPPKSVSGGMEWSDMGILAVEMEAAALYSNATAYNANALAILTISDSAKTGEATTAKEREQSFTDMMKVALSLA